LRGQYSFEPDRRACRQHDRNPRQLRRVQVPVVAAGRHVFPHDIKPAPRSYAEAFLNVCDHVEHGPAVTSQPGNGFKHADDVRRAIELGVSL
jgi:hypothetical protein